MGSVEAIGTEGCCWWATVQKECFLQPVMPFSTEGSVAACLGSHIVWQHALYDIVRISGCTEPWVVELTAASGSVSGARFVVCDALLVFWLWSLTIIA